MKNRIKRFVAVAILKIFNRSCISGKFEDGGYIIDVGKLNWFGHLSNNIMASTMPKTQEN